MEFVDCWIGQVILKVDLDHQLLILAFRYWAITSPVTYMAKRNKKTASLMILSVWVSSAFISLAPLLGWKQVNQIAFVDFKSNKTFFRLRIMETMFSRILLGNVILIEWFNSFYWIYRHIS